MAAPAPTAYRGRPHGAASKRLHGWAVPVVVLGLLVTACGGDSGDAASEQASAPPAAAQSEATEAASSASSQTSDASGGGGRTYVVESGDTLSAIANQFDTTVRAIVRANDLADADVIDVGQELKIPGS